LAAGIPSFGTIRRWLEQTRQLDADHHRFCLSAGNDEIAFFKDSTWMWLYPAWMSRDE
jgi:hypothetical protein